MSLLFQSEILELLVNTLTVNCEYSRSNTDKLQLPFQMILSEKLKTFSAFFIEFAESAFDFKHFEKKKSFIAKVFPRLLNPQNTFT